MSKAKAKYFYVYAVINFEQRLAYIGSRGSTKKPLEDHYMGSYDKNSNFQPKKKLILSTHNNREEAYEAEREWQIKFDVAKSNLFVNRGIHTSSGFSNYGRKFNQELCRQISERNKEIMNKPEMKKRLKDLSREVAIQFSIKNIKTGKVLTFESIKETARFLQVNPGDIYKLRKGRVSRLKEYCLPDTDLSIFNKTFVLEHKITRKRVQFNSRKDAAEFIGCHRSRIDGLLRGERKTVNKYFLVYENNETRNETD